MRKMLARTAVALALAGLAVPALACEMKSTTTTASAASEKSDKKTEAKAEKKVEKKAEKAPAGTVADAKR